MADPVVEVERAMIAIRRSLGRRSLSKLSRERTGDTVDQAVLGVLDAVEECGQSGTACTVTSIGQALTLDQPRASRIVARAVEDGFLRREADQRDGRKAVLVLTGAGRAQLDRMHRFRRAVFAEVMEDWPDEDKAAFGRLLGKFATRYGELSS